MSEEGNRNTLERYVQALARQDLDAIEDHLHDDYVEEYPSRVKGSVASTIGVAYCRIILAGLTSSTMALSLVESSVLPS